MSVFRELVITWKGAEVKFVPSMQLMRSIEMGDISLTDIASRTSLGRPPISHISYVLWRLLQAGGVTVSEDEVYGELIAGSQDDVTALITTVLQAFTPSSSNSKNPAARTGSPSQERAAQETENSTGT